MKKILTFLLLSLFIPLQMLADTGSIWYEEVSNGDLEGTRTICFMVKQASGTGQATITDNIGYNGSRGIGIVTDGSDDPESTALIIRTPNKTWMAGDSIEVQFMVKAQKAATIYTKSQPRTTGSTTVLVPFLDGGYQVSNYWKRISYKGVVTTAQAGRFGTQGIVVLLNTPGETNAFVFDNISVKSQEDVLIPEKYGEQVINGDLEGRNNICFKKVENSGDVVDATITDGIGYNNSRGIKVNCDGNGTKDWYSQFFITTDHVWHKGDRYIISMKAKADAAMLLDAWAMIEPEAEPGYDLTQMFLKSITDEWKDITIEGNIPSSADGMKTIGFWLNWNDTANNFYFDDISWVAVETTFNGINYALIDTSYGYGSAYVRYIEDCTGHITIPPAVTYKGKLYYVFGLYDNAFSGCDVTRVTLPEYMENIGEKAFFDCSSLTRVDMPHNLTKIGSMAFMNCTSLTSITLPAGVTQIGEGAFSGCPLSAVYCYMQTPPTLTSGTFSDMSDATLYVPAGCLSAYQNAPVWSEFGNIVEMEEPIIIDDIKYILNPNTQEATVYSCDKTGDIVIPPSVSYEGRTYAVTSIDYNAFYNKDVTSVIIPEGVTYIGYSAFNSDTLISVTLPSTLTYVGESIFAGCTNLETVYSYSTTPFDITSPIFTPNTATLYVPAGCLSAYLNAQGWSDFSNIVEMAEPFEILIGGINYELNPNTHEAMVLYKWRYAGDITIPSSVSFEDQTYAVTSIYRYAFTAMDVTSITLPEGMTTIGEGAFSSCASLTNATLPSTLTNVEFNIFYKCSHLETVYCYATTPPAVVNNEYGATILIGTPNTATLYVPAGSLSAYQNAPGWSDFSNIVEMEAAPIVYGDNMIINGDFEGTDMDAFSGQQLGGGSFNRFDYTTDNIESWEGDGNHFLYAYFTPVDINESTGEPWAYQDQLIIKLNGSLAPGDHFRFSMRAKNSGGAITINGHGNNGSVWNLLGEFNLTDEWQTFVVEGVVDETLSNDITKLELYLPVTDYSMGNFMFDDFSLKKVIETIPGDVNGDLEVDVADFTLMANYLLGKTLTVFIMEAADVAGGPGGAPDGSVDVADLTGIANIILHK